MKNKRSPCNFLDAPEISEVWESFLQKARDGDTSAQAFILARVMPGPRTGQHLPFMCPPIKTIGDLEVAENLMLKALSEKQMTVTEAKDFSSLLEAARQRLLMKDIIGRIELQDEQ